MIIGASGARPSRTADLERKLVHHCSPALAGLKPANMFVYREGADAGENPDGSAALSALDSTKFAHDLGICRKNSSRAECVSRYWHGERPVCCCTCTVQPC